MGRIQNAYEMKFRALLREVRARRPDQGVRWLLAQAARVSQQDQVQRAHALADVCERLGKKIERWRNLVSPASAHVSPIDSSSTPPVFVCDAGLGGLARWLRAAGYQAHWTRDISDDEYIKCLSDSNAQAHRLETLLLVSRRLSSLLSMTPPTPVQTDMQPHLLRRFGLLQATALNMSNMIGIGPFITIPLLMSALGGPQSMLGWLVALMITIPDGMIWSELGAAMPGSGGSYLYLREAFGRQTFGRLMAFLFIWQFILSGPLEIASGCIGFAQYLAYLWPALGKGENKILAQLMAASVAALAVVLLYRRITAVGKITIGLWVGTLLTVGAVIISGAMHFDPALAFDFPKGAFDLSWGFVWGLGTASRVGIYDYLGYYDVCYIGDEVRDPGRVIPRSILISLMVVALCYIAINLSLIGVVPWREFVPAKDPPAPVASIFMEKLYGSKVAAAFTAMVLWTAVGSIFALILGYSRIPYAAANNGDFFHVFGRLHPTKNFPHVSLVVIGVMSMLCSFLSLDVVIQALLATRILVQFIGQIFAVMALRKRAPDMKRPYRIWFYPVPCFVALAGWIFLFATTGVKTMLYGLGSLVLGLAFFLVWSWRARRWPFTSVGTSSG